MCVLLSTCLCLTITILLLNTNESLLSKSKYLYCSTCFQRLLAFLAPSDILYNKMFLGEVFWTLLACGLWCLVLWEHSMKIIQVLPCLPGCHLINIWKVLWDLCCKLLFEHNVLVLRLFKWWSFHVNAEHNQIAGCRDSKMQEWISAAFVKSHVILESIVDK